LLRIEPLGLARRDAEKGGIELLGGINEPSPTTVTHADRGGIRMMKCALAPSRLRNLIDQVAG
jgi:hypothetical protein